MEQRKFMHRITKKVFVKVHDEAYTENGILESSDVKTIVPAWVVENSSNEWKELFDLPYGQTFVVPDEARFYNRKTYFTLGKESDDNEMSVTWENGQTKRFYLTSDVARYFKNGDWVVEREFLFTTEDKVDMYRGDSWFYVNTSKLGYNPKKTSNFTYKGTKPAQVFAFSTKEAANEFLLMHRPLLSLKDVTENIGTLAKLENIAKSRM